MVAYEDVYSFPALLSAFQRARRAKRGRGAEPAFYFDLESNLLRLSDALRTRRYVPDPIRYFPLTTGARRKARIVSEASFRDRVVHHALVGATEPLFERRFIEHSYAGRTGRGLHAAVAHAKTLAAQHPAGYFLRLDIKSHFETIDHSVLMGRLSDVISDCDILWLCETLLTSAHPPGPVSGPGRGLPIGNLTSQLWANVVLHPLDQHMRDRQGLGTWARYMDDMLAVDGADDSPAAAKARLWDAALEAGTFAEQTLRLRLKPSATLVAPVQDGIPWLGLRVFPNLTRLTAPARRRMARRLCTSMVKATDPEREQREATVAAAVAGFASNADTLGLRRSVMTRALDHGRLAR